MSPSELDALYLALPIGAGNGTTIRKLSRLLEWSERRVRQGIQELRRDRHIPVVALTVTNGVFVATGPDLGALKRTRDSLRSRAMSELVTVRELDMVIADFEWSPTLFEVAS
jgi:hypothetical protein